MTSIYLIIFAIGDLEVGYVTGKTHRLCDRMGNWIGPVANENGWTA